MYEFFRLSAVFHSLVERIHGNFHKSVGVLVSKKIFLFLGGQGTLFEYFSFI